MSSRARRSPGDVVRTNATTRPDASSSKAGIPLGWPACITRALRPPSA
ncbi:hypothetical protein ATSB10_18020 [Dyella thiooxydans]|uniref:Uncharacterized protein n=1 Tax=Dyella thiooxydans TaxID=445710 RepID=A0A160N0L1_9GAMM|nr:hypothetical protein ATSB10_18020 [Dyella thiooxydans]